MVRLRQVLRGQCGRPWPAPTTPAINILPSRVTAAQAKTTGATAQWAAFKSRLDGQLGVFVAGGYEGGNLPWIMDYALGYQCLKNSDPTTATNYGNKALALMLSACQDNIRDAGQSRQFLARGDGVTTVFTLPHAPNGTLNVYLNSVATASITRGSTANTQDIVTNGVIFLKASNTSDGAANYAKGVDWQQTGNYADTLIDWSLGTANQPAAGATYYVTYVVPGSGSPLAGTAYSVSGTTLTFVTPPTSSQAILIEGVYTDADGNPYRQFGTGTGGHNNVIIDAAYTTRNLLYVAIARDWINDLPTFTSASKAIVDDCLTNWEAWVRLDTLDAMTPAQPSGLVNIARVLNGYEDNYDCGHYAFSAAVGCALNGRNALAGTIQTNVVSHRNGWIDRDLATNPTASSIYCSYKGGYYTEGWGNYAGLAIDNILLGSDILADAGFLADLTKERTYAAEAMRCFVHSIYNPSQPVSSNFVGTTYPGGDFGTWPSPLLRRDNIKIWTGFMGGSVDAQAQSYGAYFVANMTSGLLNDAYDLLYRDPSLTGGNWTATEPLAYYSSGAGLWLSRDAWDYASANVSLECADQPAAGHSTYCYGSVFLFRGQDALVVPAAEFAVSESFTYKVENGNVVMFSSTANPPQQFSQNQGPSHHSLMQATDLQTAYAYANCDYTQTYWSGSVLYAPEANRAVLHVRPGYVFVYDRAMPKTGNTMQELRWYLGSVPTVSGTGWNNTVGSSKCFGQVYSATAISTVADTVLISPVNVNRVKTNPTGTPASIRYVTLFQVGASSLVSMDASAYVTSGDGKLEGAILGSVLALFGNTKTSSGTTGYQQTTPTTYSYTAPGGTLTHYICDLTPNHTYTLSGSASGTATASSAGVLTFTTTGSGGQSVTIT